MASYFPSLYSSLLLKFWCQQGLPCSVKTALALFTFVFFPARVADVTSRAYRRMLCRLFFTGRVLLSRPGCRPQTPRCLSPLGLKACATTPDVCFTDPAETSIQHWSLNKAAAPGHELISNESMCHYMAKYFLARFLAYKR